MRKVCVLAILSLIIACNSGPKEDVSSVAPAKDSTENGSSENVSYPYTASYSSKFEIGSANHANLILSLWKDWDNNTFDNSRNSFADTVTMYFWDGTRLHASRDSILAAAKQMRGNYSKVASRVDAFIPLRSKDKNEDWVTVWGMETHTDKKGITDSINLQETWRLNKDGKADLVYQFASMTKPKKK